MRRNFHMPLFTIHIRGHLSGSPQCLLLFDHQFPETSPISYQCKNVHGPLEIQNIRRDSLEFSVSHSTNCRSLRTNCTTYEHFIVSVEMMLQCTWFGGWRGVIETPKFVAPRACSVRPCAVGRKTGGSWLSSFTAIFRGGNLADGTPSGSCEWHARCVWEALVVGVKRYLPVQY